MSLLQKLKNQLQKLVATLPVVPATVLAAAASDEEYLYVLVEAYEQQISPAVPLATLTSFTNEAAVLLLFSELRGQVENGGFIQLIQNGYGPALFDSPFTRDLREWGADQLAQLTEQAAAIYQAHRAYLERSRTIPEFSTMYKEFTVFEPLEDHFYEIIDTQAAVIRAYVAEHLDRFAHVV